ncbi:ATP-binding cassette domain-containing protein [Kribbella qitaiheensis]|uniref:ATP-binding cassette domain-containing protein n=1 Tax=Kribbella qitaiheensis TaxID=1544730 RepID=A0A7G6WSM9_9ACTN|nr:ATP-binding cassette domain-containing protein [Kribbella qitaiheensis]QNE16994.1 ATP-binding cassette domain-containing protein [Kribbella qitaiheensis]
MIEVHQLSKCYRSTQAVDDLTFTAQPGRVTAFLGPNGAGKSTTFRMLLGLDRPDSGRALINSKPYYALAKPIQRVGALLDANSAHPGRSARNHLLCIAQAARIGGSRVTEVLELTGLSEAATRRVGTYSLGMRQRLGIAAALLGEPDVLLLDEPVNGLDPEGVRWIRGLLRGLADEGRTVFVSSHLMSEMQQGADHLIVIGRGRLLADTPLSDFTADGRSLEDAYLDLADDAAQYRTGRTN